MQYPKLFVRNIKNNMLNQNIKIEIKKIKKKSKRTSQTFRLLQTYIKKTC